MQALEQSDSPSLYKARDLAKMCRVLVLMKWVRVAKSHGPSNVARYTGIVPSDACTNCLLFLVGIDVHVNLQPWVEYPSPIHLVALVKKNFHKTPQTMGIVPEVVLGSNANLIAKHHFCRSSFPPSVPARRDHKVARGIEVELRNDTCSMAGNDEEGCGCCPYFGTTIVM